LKAKIHFADPAGDYRELKSRIDHALKQELAKGAYILGEAVQDFEQSWASYLGAKYALGVASGTDALILSLLALGIKTGDEVITAANTFIATAFAIRMAGAKPVLVDACSETLNIDSGKIESAITKKTRAIIPVHLFGQPANMERIMAIAASHNLRVVEDACQAHGATFKQKKAGTFGDLSAFSFYPTKNLGGFGDGGAVVTNDPALAAKVRAARNYGSYEKNVHSIFGVNSRLDTIQAKILGIKLTRLDAWNKKRQKLAQVYEQELGKENKIKLTQIASGRTCVYHLYVVRVKNRDRVRKFLAKAGIPTMVHYPIPIHLQPAFAYLGYKPGDFPAAEQAAKTMISLPIHPRLKIEQAKFIASQLIKAVNQA